MDWTLEEDGCAAGVEAGVGGLGDCGTGAGVWTEGVDGCTAGVDDCTAGVGACTTGVGACVTGVGGGPDDGREGVGDG